MAIWQPLPSSMNLRRANNFKDGLDTKSSPLFVSENGIVDCYGLDFIQYPAVDIRKGRKRYGLAGVGKTRMIARFSDQHLLRIVGPELTYNSTGTSWVGQGAIEDADADYANFDQNGPCVFIVNGQNSYYWQPGSLNVVGDMPKAKYVTADNLRVYCANEEDSEDSIFYSAFQNGIDWTSPENSGKVQYWTAAGGPITAIHAFNGAVWVFKKNSFAIIFHTGDANLSYRLVNVSDYIGCVAYRTVAEVGPYLMWLGEDNVYIGVDSNAKQVGEELRGILNTINRDAITSSFAYANNENYYLHFPTGTNTEPDTCVVYNYLHRQWRVFSKTLNGLRAGVRFNNILYAGDDKGQTFEMMTSEDDDGTPIPWMIQSRPYDDGVKEAEKELHHLYFQGYFEHILTMKVEVSPDDDSTEWLPIEYDPVANGAGLTSNSKRLIVPLDVVPLCNFYAYRISGTGRGQFAEVQRYSRIQPVQE